VELHSARSHRERYPPHRGARSTLGKKQGRIPARPLAAQSVETLRNSKGREEEVRPWSDVIRKTRPLRTGR
jgi:hypothetical protein